MPTLKDYLGSLVKDLNYARVIADVESANIARMYAQDDLLKHFSIPRMKIQDTELTIPICIDELEHLPQKDYQPIDNVAFKAATYAEIKNVLQVSSFNALLYKNLKKSIYPSIDTLEKEVKGGADIQTSLDSFCQKVASDSMELIKTEHIRKPIKSAVLKDRSIDKKSIINTLKEKLKVYLAPAIKQRVLSASIQNAKVTVETDKLREKKPENLVYIKKKITEESMEWQTMEDADGNIVSKLIVE